MGHAVSEETRRKLSDARKGRSQSEESRRKQSESMKGRRKSPETITKMRAYHANRPPEHNRNISRGMTGKKITPEHAENARRSRMASGVWKPIGHTYERRGYVWEKVSERCGRDNYVAQHRLVVQRRIGRALDPDEHVHHIDGNTRNNADDNLFIVSKRDHRLIHQTIGVLDEKLATIIFSALMQRFPNLGSEN